MNELSAEARRLIENARPAEAPPTTARSRVHGAVAARIAAAGQTGGVAAKAAAGPPAAAAHSGHLLAGAVIAAVVATSAVVGIVWLRGSPPTTPAASRPAPSSMHLASPSTAPNGPEAVAPAAAPASHDVSSRPAQPALRRPTVSRSTARSSPVVDGAPAPAAAASECSAQEEIALLEVAQAALRESDGQRGLGVLDRYEKECSRARFREEHRAVRVLALCLLGQRESAAAEAARLVAESPRSPQLVRLRSSCAAPALGAR